MTSAPKFGTYGIPVKADAHGHDIVPAANQHLCDQHSCRKHGQPVQRQAHGPDNVAPPDEATCRPNQKRPHGSARGRETV